MQITHWNAPKLEQVQITTLKCCIRMGASATCNAPKMQASTNFNTGNPAELGQMQITTLDC
jgi:hypothetical protein